MMKPSAGVSLVFRRYVWRIADLFVLLCTYNLEEMSKTYLAYDATGVIDHVNSNLHSFHTMHEWQRSNPERFHFLNMEEIDFSSMHDDMVDTTVKRQLTDAMAKADNLLVLASPVINVDSEILNWQISRGVNRFHLPVIVAYVGLERVDDDTIQTYWTWLPQKIRKYIARDSARMAHVPFTKDKLERALKAYSLSEGSYPWDSVTIY